MNGAPYKVKKKNYKNHNFSPYNTTLDEANR